MLCCCCWTSAAWALCPDSKLCGSPLLTCALLPLICETTRRMGRAVALRHNILFYESRQTLNAAATPVYIDVWGLLWSHFPLFEELKSVDLPWWMRRRVKSATWACFKRTWRKTLHRTETVLSCVAVGRSKLERMPLLLAALDSSKFVYTNAQCCRANWQSALWKCGEIDPNSLADCKLHRREYGFGKGGRRKGNWQQRKGKIEGFEQLYCRHSSQAAKLRRRSGTLVGCPMRKCEVNAAQGWPRSATSMVRLFCPYRFDLGSSNSLL